jgi:hypothetical protein
MVGMKFSSQNRRIISVKEDDHHFLSQVSTLLAYRLQKKIVFINKMNVSFGNCSVPTPDQKKVSAAWYKSGTVLEHQMHHT